MHGGVRLAGPVDGLRRPAHVVRAGHPEPAAGRQPPAPLAPAARRLHPVEALGKAVAVHEEVVRGDRRCVDEVRAPYREGVEPELRRHLVEQGLEREAHVDRAVAPHRPARGGVGEHPAPAVADVLEVVERVEERARVEDGDDPVSGIGAAALHGLALDPGDAAVAPEPELQTHRLLGTPPVGEEGLFAGGHEAHRPARLAGEEGADDLDVEGLGAAAEAAPDVRLDHPDPRLLQVEAAREHEVDVVGDLGARVHGEPAPLRVVVREGGVHLHLGLADLGAAVGLLPHEVGAGQAPRPGPRSRTRRPARGCRGASRGGRSRRGRAPLRPCSTRAAPRPRPG